MTLEENGLSHSEIDTYLEHAGVKGMKWGTRRQFAKDVNAQRDKVIDVAREYVNSGKAKKDLYTDKGQRAIERKTLGKAAAQALFVDRRDNIYKLANYATQAKTGKETVVKLIGGPVGLMAYQQIKGTGPGLSQRLPGNPLNNYASRNRPEAHRFSSTPVKVAMLKKLLTTP